MYTSPPEIRRWTMSGLVRLIESPTSAPTMRPTSTSTSTKHFSLRAHDHTGRLLFTVPIKGPSNVLQAFAARGLMFDLTADPSTLCILTVCPVAQLPMLLTPRQRISSGHFSPQMALLTDMFGGVHGLTSLGLHSPPQRGYDLRYAFRGETYASDLMAIGLRATLLEPYEALLRRAGSPDHILCLPRPVDLRQYYGAWGEVYEAQGAPPASQWKPAHLIHLFDLAAEQKAKDLADHTQILDTLASQPYPEAMATVRKSLQLNP